ncbi:hypothetical protein ADIWIN_3343 [Winogradskyella psychrotolerans RS-3]|uniref:Uncharacterized protein n=1 Tax=Winogradskyella psychrotolerans RS-3 TaxID=641526 RepID=S7VLB2_9FLAO|nr:DUF6175 family protein [Winogradskyella psychrotolerans]EPR70696.1 hypothetical protein ADIWIN_3343 [Winogradskyella psychrotolerans RS-3]
MKLQKQILVLFSTLLAINLSFSQAKKPTLMVVPADTWCYENGYSQTIDNQGVVKDIPLYQMALQRNSDLALVITQINGLLSERGFSAKDLSAELKKVEAKSAEQELRSSKNTGSEVSETPIDALKKAAKADIILEMSWAITDNGLEKQVTFILRGLDAYTGKQIAETSGTGAPDFSSPLPILLEEAVSSRIDKFLASLQTTFEGWFEKGREVNLGIRVWDDWEYDLESDNFGDDELSFLIENWLDANSVNGSYTTMDAEATMMNFEQVRIPMTYERNGKIRGLDARNWAKGLSDYLKDLGIVNKLTIRGLGEATLYLGSK